MVAKQIQYKKKGVFYQGIIVPFFHKLTLLSFAKTHAPTGLMCGTNTSLFSDLFGDNRSYAFFSVCGFGCTHFFG